ncbi:MAG: DEAD/DEAH box helicase [Planctomycetota bacterium]
MIDPLPADPGGLDEAPRTFRGLDLFPFQRRAIAAIFSGRSVVVAAPTGAGKTLVADYAMEESLAADRRVVYTSPIKALSNQKYRDFRAQYGEQRVGLMTGDVTLQPGASLLVMTTEIFRNTIFEDPRRLEGFDFVVFDEVHYLDDRERGTVWEESIIFAPPHMRIVGLSATVPNVQQFADWISDVRQTPVEVIVEEERPVPLTHEVWIPGRGPRSLPQVRTYFEESGRREKPGRRHRAHGRGRGGKHFSRRGRRAQEELLGEASAKLVDHLERRRLLPAIYFCFSRLDCERLPRPTGFRDLLPPAEPRRMLALFDELAERYEVEDAHDTIQIRSLAARGVLYHHAGMLPIDKEIVERLFTTGLVKLLFATETFSLGVNMPARTVAFHTLCKYDGLKYGRILVREYWQMAGRAGRQGIDERGSVFALLDESRIAYADLVRLQSGRAEPVISRFNLSYSGILNLYRRVGEGVTDAWKRSFARYQLRDAGRRGGPRKGGAAQIRARLDLLEAHDYVEDGGLTRKGRLCAKINGYEIAVTEAYEKGWLNRCDATEMAMLFSAIVYESRPSDSSAPPRRRLKGIAVPFTLHMEAFAADEAARGIAALTRPPDFAIAGPAELWAEGKDFERMLGKTSLAPGDLVRVFRMTVQLLRQLRHALSAEDPVTEVLHEAQDRIARDVVDARRQLELG